MKDRFSKQSDDYSIYRPSYPKELFDYILSQCSFSNSAWDCGTGNGQFAAVLSNHFSKVFATDISEKQIKNAIYKPNIFYKVESAEKTSFEANTFDLVTTSQAIHWFDIEKFNKEVRRTLKPDGLFAAVGYSLVQTYPDVNGLIHDFYSNVLEGCWDRERHLVDEAYQTIPFNFDEIKTCKKFSINRTWTLSDLKGYIKTWSGVQNFIDKNNYNPVGELIEKIDRVIQDSSRIDIEFPIFLRVGKVHK